MGDYNVRSYPQGGPIGYRSWQLRATLNASGFISNWLVNQVSTAWQRKTMHPGKAGTARPKLPLLFAGGVAVLLCVFPVSGQETATERRLRLLDDRYRRAVEENVKLKEALDAARIEAATLRQILTQPEQYARYHAAIEHLTRALEKEPDNAALYRSRGIALRHLGAYVGSIQDLDRAIQREGSDARSYNERGTAYFLTRDLERAQQDFSKAIALDPELAEAYHNRAVISRRLGDYSRAVKDLRTAGRLGVAESEQTRNRLSAEVEAIQRRLDQLGLDPGPVDGIPGPKTVAALRRLQRDNGIEATGRVDASTKAALQTTRRVSHSARKTKSARLLTKPRLEYPAAARESGWEGTVTLRIELLESGRVGDIEVAKSSGHRILDEAAIENVKGWRHQPVTENGVPVTRTIDFDIEFALDAKRR